MQLNFYENIYSTLSRNPEQVLIVWPDMEVADAKKVVHSRRYSGRDILNKVSAYRSVFEKKNIRRGEEVLLAMPVSFELICALLAVMAHGAIPVLPAAGSGPVDLFRLIRKRPVKALLTAMRLNILPSLLLAALRIKQYTFQPEEHQAAPLIGEWEPGVLVEAEQPALISHSSGSTGNAKAIYRSHRILLAQHQALKDTFSPFPEQRDFPLFPNILLHNLSIGVRSVLPALSGFDILRTVPSRLLAQLEAEHIHTLTGNVYYFQKILTYLQEQPRIYRKVRALGIGGSPVPEPLLSGLKNYFAEATIYVIYGSTEAEPMAVRKLEGGSPDPAAGYAVGRFIPSLQWRIRPLGKTAVNGVQHTVGEIEVKGPHVVTQEKEGWLKTGDFGYVNEQAELFLTGRNGNEGMHAGLQHYQLEHFLLHMEGVERAAAISGIKGFDVYLQGREIDMKKVSARLKEVFPEEVIGTLQLREHIPVDARHHSKVLYTKLRR